MIAVWSAVVAIALAAAPTCDPPLQPLADELSVAWVSPLGQTVGRRGWLQVVPTADLRTAVKGGVSLGRTLQILGLRRKEREPRRRYKVTVFDVRAGDLCRPLAEAAPGDGVVGVPACPSRRSQPTREQDGCGRTVDRRTGEPGLQRFWIRWEDAARNGFCVLPAHRFLSAHR